MKQPRKLLEGAARRLDLPAEVMAGLPQMTVSGFSQVTVEHHRGILEYTDEAVTVALNIGRVRITGPGLTIPLMNHDYVIVRGTLENMALGAGGGHD